MSVAQIIQYRLQINKIWLWSTGGITWTGDNLTQFHFVHTNHIWLGPQSNSRLKSGKPVSKCFNHGMQFDRRVLKSHRNMLPPPSSSSYSEHFKAHYSKQRLLLLILSLAPDGGEWSSYPNHSTPGTDPCTSWTGGWVVPIASLEVLGKRKSLTTYRDSNPSLSYSLYQLSYAGCILRSYIFVFLSSCPALWRVIFRWHNLIASLTCVPNYINVANNMHRLSVFIISSSICELLGSDNAEQYRRTQNFNQILTKFYHFTLVV